MNKLYRAYNAATNRLHTNARLIETSLTNEQIDAINFLTRTLGTALNSGDYYSTEVQSSWDSFKSYFPDGYLWGLLGTHPLYPSGLEVWNEYVKVVRTLPKASQQGYKTPPQRASGKSWCDGLTLDQAISALEDATGGHEHHEKRRQKEDDEEAKQKQARINKIHALVVDFQSYLNKLEDDWDEVYAAREDPSTSVSQWVVSGIRQMRNVAETYDEGNKPSDYDKYGILQNLFVGGRLGRSDRNAVVIERWKERYKKFLKDMDNNPYPGRY